MLAVPITGAQTRLYWDPDRSSQRWAIMRTAESPGTFRHRLSWHGTSGTCGRSINAARSATTTSVASCGCASADRIRLSRCGGFLARTVTGCACSTWPTTAAEMCLTHAAYKVSGVGAGAPGFAGAWNARRGRNPSHPMMVSSLSGHWLPCRRLSRHNRLSRQIRLSRHWLRTSRRGGRLILVLILLLSRGMIWCRTRQWLERRRLQRSRGCRTVGDWERLRLSCWGCQRSGCRGCLSCLSCWDWERLRLSCWERLRLRCRGCLSCLSCSCWGHQRRRLSPRHHRLSRRRCRLSPRHHRLSRRIAARSS